MLENRIFSELVDLKETKQKQPKKIPDTGLLVTFTEQILSGELLFGAVIVNAFPLLIRNLY